jgi:hypothetical protein
MFDLFRKMIGGRQSRQVEEPSNRISPTYVEQLITEAGRERVFARARELGWTNGALPPLWVWNQIAMEIIAQRSASEVMRERGNATLN